MRGGNPVIAGDVHKYLDELPGGIHESHYIKADHDRVVDAKFKTFGCGAAIATSSMCTEMVRGKTIDEALAITREQVAEELGGLPPVKMHCSNLAADALHAAINEYQCKKDGQCKGAEEGTKKS